MDGHIRREILDLRLNDYSTGRNADAVSLRADNYQFDRLENGDLVIRADDDRGKVAIYLHGLQVLPLAESMQQQLDDLQDAAFEIRGLSDEYTDNIAQQELNKIHDRAEEIVTALESLNMELDKEITNGSNH